MCNEDLVLLIRQTDNPAHAEELYNQNLGMIRKVVGYFSKYCDYDDLMQESYLYLMQAVKLWDPDQGTSFSTYLFSVLRYNMRRYCESQNGVKVPAGIGALVRRYEKACSQFMVNFDREPSPEEALIILQIDRDKLEQIKRAMSAMKPSKSLQEELSGVEDLTLQDVIPDKDNQDQFEIVEDGIDRERAFSVLWDIVDSLGERESAVLRSKYQEGLDIKGIAEKLSMSQNEAQNATHRALRKLRSGPIRSKLNTLYFDIYGDAMKHSGLTYFRNHNTSATEQTALNMIDGKYMSLREIYQGRKCN